MRRPVPAGPVLAVMARAVAALALSLLPASGRAQFTLQQSHTTASLRGIADVDAKVAWASGTAGTVLRTLDGGIVWQACTVPSGAGSLDFRGIQAWDAQNAVVMSSGKGNLSRIYRTEDGCRTWKLLYTNPDAPDGFFDAILFATPGDGWLLGDSVRGRYVLEHTQDGGISWQRSTSATLSVPAQGGGGAFAASNQSLALSSSGPIFGGADGWVYQGPFPSCSLSIGYNEPEQCLAGMTFRQARLPMAQGTAASGLFAIDANTRAIVAVGGNYQAPADPAGTAAFSRNNGVVWQPSASLPHGYRSSIAFDQGTSTWIAIGPNGTDISTDDGEHWKALRPNPAEGDSNDADSNWNALSLPFAVGPRGRIGRLRDNALTPGAH